MSDDIHAAEPTAALLLANARGFLQASFHSPDREVSDEQLHMVAISVELALKAALIAAALATDGTATTSVTIWQRPQIMQPITALPCENGCVL